MRICSAGLIERGEQERFQPEEVARGLDFDFAGPFKSLDIKLLVVYSQTMNIPPWTTLDQAIERSKSEILGDIAEGIIPATCASYSELHDYVDANGYGGAFEHDFDNEETDFWNAVQDAVDAWIKAGGLNS